MKRIKLFLTLLFVTNILCFAGNLELKGEIQPGNLIVGVADKAISVTLNNQPLQYDESEGLFLIGFDRDDIGTYYLRVKFADGSVIAKKIILPERKYNIQRIKVNHRFVEPPASEIPKIDKQREIKKAAWAKMGEVDDALYASGFKKPINSRRKTGVFGSKRVFNNFEKDPHNGVDYAAPRGRNVYATADGIVKLAADNFYYSGNFILLDHGQGLSSVYIHLSKKSVKEGDFVKKGEKVGEVGSTGRSTGPHLHWGVKWFDKRIDPESLLKIKLNN